MNDEYLGMIQKVYQNYFDDSGKCKIQNVEKLEMKDVYDCLTSEPYSQARGYFDEVSSDLIRLFQSKVERDIVNLDKTKYYIVYIGQQTEGPTLSIRVVANIASQAAAIKIADDIYHNPQFPTIYQYKVLLGSPKEEKHTEMEAIKSDKIVIYNKIPLPKDKKCLLISKYLDEQIRYLSNYCPSNALLPQFVLQPYKGIPVGVGEGVTYGNQAMAFSEPRAVSILEVIKQVGSKGIFLKDFNGLLSEKFKDHNLSDKIPYMNSESEGKWCW